MLLHALTMHRFPRIFTHSSDRRKTDDDSSSGSSTSSRRAKPKPVLDRRNARKNIDYDYSTSSSSSSYYTSEESVRARSLELYGGGQSFRVEGVDGELEIICKTLGFSGIGDFSISPEDFEGMKVRSSSGDCCNEIGLNGKTRNRNVVHQLVTSTAREENSETPDSGAVDSRHSNSDFEVVSLLNKEIGEVVSRDCEGILDLRSRANTGAGVSVEDSVRIRANSSISNDNRGVIRSNELRGVGIRGIRPPVLGLGLPAPPPFMSLPVINQACSTWDIFREFGPDSDRPPSLDKDGGLNRIEEENRVLTSSSSSSTNSNEDDSSSSTTDPISSVSPNRRGRRVITTWQKGDPLGRGSFGSVYEGIADSDGFFFAVKEVSLLDQGGEGRQSIAQLEQEIALLKQFEHENIVQYYGTAKDDSHLYIYLELVTKGSLLSLYQKYALRDSVVSAYTRQILHGLKYLHDQGVVHRDIKCANILVHTNGLVKLADFGLAKATKSNDVKSCKGTAFWMAPEVVRSQGYGLPADIWSLGCTVLEMLTRRFPYGNMECMAALFKIGRGIRPTIPDSLSTDAREFILECLIVDPSVRPTAAALLDHPFVKRPLSVSLAAALPRHFSI